MTTPVHQAKRSWIARHPILTVLILLFLAPVLLISVLAAIISDPSPSNSNTNQTPAAPATTEQQSEPPRQQLNASVSHNASAVSIRNNETVPWGRCEYTLNSKYDYKGGNVIIPVNNPVELPFADFVDSKNMRFNVFEQRPDYLKVQCYRDGTQFADGDYFFQ